MSRSVEPGTLVTAPGHMLMYLGHYYWMWQNGRVERLRGFTMEIETKGYFGLYTLKET